MEVQVSQGAKVTGPSGINGRRSLRVMPWWAAGIGITAVVGAVAISMLILLSIAGHNAVLRIEAIKIGLSVGAGVGAAAALLLAFRRQWLNERAQAHIEDVARDTSYDANQRRITDLYAKAVEQIGHDSAAVRLGGLYALDRLAKDIEHRQTVVEVLCAYLRMPFATNPNDYRTLARRSSTGIDLTSGEGVIADDREQELQVRLAAQRLLASHLKDPLVPHRKLDEGKAMTEIYWDNVRIDLTGAHLIDFDFVDCRIGYADFRGAHFSAVARFTRSHFTKEALFSNTFFEGDARFHGAVFDEGARFTLSQFHGRAWFNWAQFQNSAKFVKAEFSHETEFTNVKFAKSVLFIDTRFREEPDFTNATASLKGNYIRHFPTLWQELQPVPEEGISRLVRSDQSVMGKEPVVTADGELTADNKLADDEFTADNKLYEETLQAIEEVKRTGSPIPLIPMSRGQRRWVHAFVAGYGLETKSKGNAPERRVTILPPRDAWQ